jgi:hypothetical protein
MASEVPFSESTAVQYLQQVSAAVICHDNLGRLAGRVAVAVQQQLLVQDAMTASSLATAYLQAAAKQLQSCRTGSARDVPSNLIQAEYVRDVVQVCNDDRVIIC